MIDFLADPFQYIKLPVGDWAALGLQWMVDQFRDFFQAVRLPVQIVLRAIQDWLAAMPPLVIIGGLVLLGWQIGGVNTALIIALCLCSIGVIGAWAEAMITLSIVLTAIVFCCSVGIPLGILSARYDRFQAMLRYVLDFLQTIPSFVYLVPVVMLFGIGNVPGIIVTIVYAISPVIRLTSLGIRQVRPDVVEAARAFGASPNQILFKVQLPLAMPTIMAGVNQTVMMALSMVVVGALIAVTGLGRLVLRGIGQLDMAMATTGGLGIVLLAITIDRISQGFGLSLRERGHQKWFERGPIGFVRGVLARVPIARPASEAR